jgi:hypothetical protein
MPPSRYTDIMKRDHEVQVLAKARLKSELAMFIWAQSELRREHRIERGEEPRNNGSFLQSKEKLTVEVLKLAGRKILFLDLISRLRDIIGRGRNEEIRLLDPQNMASKISARVLPKA